MIGYQKLISSSRHNYCFLNGENILFETVEVIWPNNELDRTVAPKNQGAHNFVKIDHNVWSQHIHTIKNIVSLPLSKRMSLAITERNNYKLALRCAGSVQEHP